jgi:hypothetical protein
MSGHPGALTHSPLSYFHESLPLRFPTFVAPDDRLIMNIYGYFDESGTHKGSPALAVGGFLAKADEWGAFTYEWEKALKDWGLPFFHMADFESRLGDYADWPNDVRKERLNRLLGIIGRHVIASVGTVISIADYDAVFPEDEAPEAPNTQEFAPGIWTPWSLEPGEPEPEVSLKPGDIRRKSGGPYGLAAVEMCAEVARRVSPLVGDPFVAYVFESGATGAGQILKVFQGMMAREETRISMRILSIAFEDKRLFPPLQAADLLAYELHKQLPRQLGIETRPRRYPLRELHKLPHSWGTMDAEEMRKWHYVLGRGLYYSEGTWQK